MIVRLPFGRVLSVRVYKPTHSFYKRIIKRQDDAFRAQVREIKNALAARDTLRTRDAGFDLNHWNEKSDEYLDFLAGLQAGFAQKQQERERRMGIEREGWDTPPEAA